MKTTSSSIYALTIRKNTNMNSSFMNVVAIEYGISTIVEIHSETLLVRHYLVQAVAKDLTTITKAIIRIISAGEMSSKFVHGISRLMKR